LKTLRSRRHRALCAALAQARTDSELSQRDLARRMKRAHSFVAKNENGERRVDVVEFIEIAQAMGVDPIKLFAKVLQ
jgi:transcriptional regulator with XRE-family HTH domain